MRESEMRTEAGRYVGEAIASKRLPTAHELAQTLELLATRAEQLSEKVRGKLTPIMVSDFPQNGLVAGCEKEREWPPLFADMRTSARRINSALESVEYDLSRADV